MAINAAGLQVGPGYLFDPATRLYYQGASAGAPMAPTGDSAYDYRTQDPNYGSQLWGASPGSFGNYGVGSTQYNFAQSGQGSPVNLGDFTNIPQNLQGWFAPGTSIQSYNKAPQATQVTQAPEESFLSSFMQGPGMVLGSALGANALFGGGLPGLGNLFSGNGGGMSGIGDWFSNLFGGGAPDFSNVVWDQAPGGLSQAVTGGGGNAVFDLNNLGAASGATIPATNWGNSAGNIWNTASNASSIVKGMSNTGLLGGALGALAGGIGANSKPAGTVTSIQDIPDYLKPYQSMNLTSGANNFAAAGSGASLLPGAQQYLQNTINGQYLDPNQNPAFAPYVKDLMGQAGANYASLYGKNPDALNNSGFQEGYTRAITNAALPLYNSAFQTAQGNQFNAAQNAPGFANNVAGATLAPNLAFKNLYTGPQSTTNPYFTSPLGGALSGGLAGYTLGNSIFGGK